MHQKSYIKSQPSYPHQATTFSKHASFPKCGRAEQEPLPDKDSSVMDYTTKKKMQQIAGSLLHYARAFNPTIVNALGSNATQQSNSSLTMLPIKV